MKINSHIGNSNLEQKQLEAREVVSSYIAGRLSKHQADVALNYLGFTSSFIGEPDIRDFGDLEHD